MLLSRKMEIKLASLEAAIMELRKSPIPISSPIPALVNRVRFDLRGTIFTTSLNTCLKIKDSLFQRHFAQNCSASPPLQMEADGTFFIDRKPDVFSHILEFMEHDEIKLEKLSSEKLAMLLSDASHYSLQALSDEIYSHCLTCVKGKKLGDFVTPLVGDLKDFQDLVAVLIHADPVHLTPHMPQLIQQFEMKINFDQVVRLFAEVDRSLLQPYTHFLLPRFIGQMTFGQLVVLLTKANKALIKPHVTSLIRPFEKTLSFGKLATLLALLPPHEATRLADSVIPKLSPARALVVKL